MEIRPATVADAVVLATLNRYVHEPHVSAEPELYRLTQPDEVAEWFLRRLGSGDLAFIAEEGGESVGYVMARVVERQGHLFVHPRRFLLVDQLAVAQRRRGVGRALMGAAESHALAIGVEAVELDVRAANSDAIVFYEALGYQIEQLHYRRPLAKK